MDVHASDQSGVVCFLQNSGLFKPWRPMATIRGGISGSFPVPPLKLKPTFFPSYLEIIVSNSRTANFFGKYISIEMTIGQLKKARVFIFKVHYTLCRLIEREIYPD